MGDVAVRVRMRVKVGRVRALRLRWSWSSDLGSYIARVRGFVLTVYDVPGSGVWRVEIEAEDEDGGCMLARFGRYVTSEEAQRKAERRLHRIVKARMRDARHVVRRLER